jgi:hypothetical protein
MNEALEQLCKANNVDLSNLYEQISMAANVVGPDTIIRADLTVGQYRILRACMEVAGEF